MLESPAILGLGDYGNKIPYKESMALIERFVELGGKWLDTAHCYAFWIGPGHTGDADRIAGEALRRHPGLKAILKGAHVGMGDGYPRPDDFMNPAFAAGDLRESLDRMGREKADLWLWHRDDPRIPVETIVEIGAQFVLEGKADAWGVSNWSGTRVQEAQSAAARLGLPGIAVVENQWSLAKPNWTMDGTPGEVRYPTEEEAPLLLDAGVEVAAYTPSALGFFSGREAGTFDSEENRALRDRVQEAAKEHGRTPTQVALDWLRSQAVPTVPIVGTSSMIHLEEAMTLPGIVA